MEREKPILFNTDMVQAVLDGGKRATRRTVKQPVWENFVCEGGKAVHYLDKKTGSLKSPLYKAPCQVGDILYVREAWAFQCCIECMNQLEDGTCMLGKRPTIHEDKDAESEGCYIYRGGHSHPDRIVWRPSIHMPKDAARIWLKVTGVAVERLHGMTLDDFLSEGVVLRPEAFNDPENSYRQAREIFKGIWDSTVPKKQLARYGWDANPWVWAVKFERREKPAAGKEAGSRETDNAF